MLEAIRHWEILPRSFYERPAIEVAQSLLGMVIIHNECAGRIVEVEAYLGEQDPAAHAARGLTPRTRVIYGDAGHAYVYFIYGMYECLNLVAERAGSPGCVLIRALEPLAGLELMRERRNTHRVQDLMSGPGKLTRAMAITRALNGADVTAGDFTVRRPPDLENVEIATGPRVGIREAADWPLRFAIRNSLFVSKPRPF